MPLGAGEPALAEVVVERAIGHKSIYLGALNVLIRRLFWLTKCRLESVSGSINHEAE